MSETTICSIKGCDKQVRARTWCVTHWQHWYRNGDPLKTVKNYEKHGMFRTQGYASWKSIKQRILNPKAPYFEYYGGRGLTVCSGIANSFSTFISSIGERPNPSLTVDRIDNNKGYFCGSCDECQKNNQTLNMRWATKSEQQHNSRRYEVAVL